MISALGKVSLGQGWIYLAYSCDSLKILDDHAPQPIASGPLRLAFTIMCKLSKRYGIIPPAYFTAPSTLWTIGTQPESYGGFADVWLGRSHCQQFDGTFSTFEVAIKGQALCIQSTASTPRQRVMGWLELSNTWLQSSWTQNAMD